MSSQVPKNKQKPCRALRILGPLEGFEAVQRGCFGVLKREQFLRGQDFWGNNNKFHILGVFVLMVDPLPLPLGGGYPGDVVIPDEKPL